MTISKKILKLSVCFLVLSAFSLTANDSSDKIDKVIWKVQITDNNSENKWIEFKTYGEKKETTDGLFTICQGDKDKYLQIKVFYLKIDGDFAWFAGQCTEDKKNGKLTNRWIFLVVCDWGKPGRLFDHLWYEWLPDSEDAQELAKKKVKNLEKSEENKPIKSGDISVYPYEEITTVERLP